MPAGESAPGLGDTSRPARGGGRQLALSRVRTEALKSTNNAIGDLIVVITYAGGLKFVTDFARTRPVL
jgi:hypothetical protein